MNESATRQKSDMKNLLEIVMHGVFLSVHSLPSSQLP